MGLFVGAFYVLLPTILQQDSEDLLSDQAGSVKTTEAAPELKLKYRVEDGDMDAMVDAVNARLAGNDGVERAYRNDNQLIVVVRVGSEPEAIHAALAPGQVVDLIALDAGADATRSLSELLMDPAVTGVDVRSASTLDVGLATFDGFGAGTLTSASSTLPALMGIRVDGVLAGLAQSSANGENATSEDIAVAVLPGAPSISGALANVALPGSLVRITADAAVGTDALQAVSNSSEKGWEPPAWLVGMLPDTRMPLGLDLMGGIDLTLQVELDEALVAQAKRDATYIEQSAKNEKSDVEPVAIDGIDFDRFEPIIKIKTEETATAMSGFVAKTMSGDYEYFDTQDGAHWYTMVSNRQEEVTDQAVKQVLDTVRRRVADIGVRDPVVVKKGGGKISVQLPGLTNLEGAVGSVSKTAVLEFRLVDEEFSPIDVRKLLAVAREKMPEAQFNQDGLVNEWLWQTGRLKKNRILQWEYEDSRDEDTNEVIHSRMRALPLELPVILTGADVNSADVGFDAQTQQANVSLSFKPKGSKIFCDVTGERVGKRFAIILDGEIKSAPNIRERICGGQASITMGSSLNASQDAKTLAVVLGQGP